MTEKLITFSIIIPTYNRPEKLKTCLDSLLNLDYPPDNFEIIIVDDGSNQPLDTLIKPYQNQLNLTLIRQENAGPAKARNTGANRAKGEYLAFTDDDCTLDSKWLQSLEKGCLETPNALLGGKIINALPDNPYSTASQVLFDYLYDYYNSNFVQTRFFTTNNFALSRELFNRVGQLDIYFRFGEDREFCDRWLFAGYSLHYLPQAIIYHGHDLSLRRFWQQHFNYGCAAFYFHQIRSHRHQTALKFEPLSFYFQLLTYPFSKKCEQRSKIFLFGLLLISQLANIWGFLKAKYLAL